MILTRGGLIQLPRPQNNALRVLINVARENISPAEEVWDEIPIGVPRGPSGTKTRPTRAIMSGIMDTPISKRRRIRVSGSERDSESDRETSSARVNSEAIQSGVMDTPNKEKGKEKAITPSRSNRRGTTTRRKDKQTNKNEGEARGRIYHDDGIAPRTGTAQATTEDIVQTMSAVIRTALREERERTDMMLLEQREAYGDELRRALGQSTVGDIMEEERLISSSPELEERNRRLLQQQAVTPFMSTRNDSIPSCRLDTELREAAGTVIKRSKIKFPEFAGERELVNTLRLKANIRRGYGEVDEVILHDMMGCMKGGATHWLGQLIKQEGLPGSLDKLIDQIERQYDPKIGLGEAAVNIGKMRQKEDETVNTYALRLSTEAHRAGLQTDGVMMKNALIKGLRRKKTMARAMTWMTSETANMRWETFVERVANADGIIIATESFANSDKPPVKEVPHINYAGIEPAQVDHRGANAASMQGGGNARQYPRPYRGRGGGGRGRGNPSNRGTCLICGKFGHWVDKCWHNSLAWPAQDDTGQGTIQAQDNRSYTDRGQAIVARGQPSGRPPRGQGYPNFRGRGGGFRGRGRGGNPQERTDPYGTENNVGNTNMVQDTTSEERESQEDHLKE